MEKSVSASTTAPSDNGVASVARLQGYLGMLDAILGVCRQTGREGETGSQARCYEAMLADCREHFCGYLKRMDCTHQTAWEMGLSDLLEGLWETINPMPHVSDAELIGRVQKARRLTVVLEKMLSALVVLEAIYPADVEDACQRLYADDEDAPF